MGSYSDPALILPGAVGQTELSADSKKDVTGGVAGIGSGNELLSPGGSVFLVPDGNGDIFIVNRTAGANIAKGHFIDANNTQLFVVSAGAYSELQHSAMKDAASGIAGLDANGIINRIGQASLDAAPVGDFESGTDIYHAHDAEIDNGTGSYGMTIMKTITLNQLPNSVLRIYFELYPGGGAGISSDARVYRNGTPVGINLHSTVPNNWISQIENISDWEVGDTLELYMSKAGASTSKVRNFRILCDTKEMSNS